MSEKSEVNAKKGSFFSNMFAELKKVVWPSKEQTAKGTGTVIIFVLIITFVLVVLNFLFQELNNLYWGLFTK